MILGHFPFLPSSENKRKTLGSLHKQESRREARVLFLISPSHRKDTLLNSISQRFFVRTLKTVQKKTKKNIADFYLKTAKMTVLSSNMHCAVPILIHFIQGDSLFLHKLQQPQQDPFLKQIVSLNASINIENKNLTGLIYLVVYSLPDHIVLHSGLDLGGPVCS